MKELLSNPISAVAIGLVLVAFLCYRQLQKRPVRESRGFRGVLIIGVIGLVQASGSVAHVPAIEIVTTVLSLVLGAGFGILRGRTAHLWREHGTLYRQGNAITIVLWVVGIAVHIGLDTLGGALAATSSARSGSNFGSSTVLVYIAVSLAAQQLMLTRRAETAAPRLPA